MAVTCIKLPKDRGGFLNLKYSTEYTNDLKPEIVVKLYICDNDFKPVDEERPCLQFKEMTESEYHTLLRSVYKNHIVEELSTQI